MKLGVHSRGAASACIGLQDIELEQICFHAYGRAASALCKHRYPHRAMWRMQLEP